LPVFGACRALIENSLIVQSNTINAEDNSGVGFELGGALALA